MTPPPANIPVDLITTDEERDAACEWEPSGRWTKPGGKPGGFLQESVFQDQDLHRSRAPGTFWVVNHDETTRNKILELFAERRRPDQRRRDPQRSAGSLKDAHFEAAVLELESA